MNLFLLLVETVTVGTGGGIISILIYLLVAALIIGLIYYIACLAFPSAANIIKIVCLVAFLLVLLFMLLPLLGVH